MNIPDNPIADINDDNDNPRNLSNQQESFESAESDFSSDFDDDIPVNEDSTDLLQQAMDSSEPSYTLNVDKGISEDPDKNNKSSNKGDYNAKQ